MAHNVLITAASRRVALVRAFQDALARRAPGSVVIATDISPWSPAVHVADRARRVPRSDAAGYVDTLLAICEADGVRLLVPTIDDELEVIAAARPRFAAVGVQVAVPTVDTVRICRDKAITSAYLASHGIAAPATWTAETIDVERVPLPLFIKPRCGRGSVGAYPVHTRDELRFFLGYVPDAIVQTYLHAPEYTVDLLCDFDGALLSVVPRERQVIRSGVTDRGCTVDDPRLIELARRCAGAFEFRGAVNFQCRMVGETPVIFEINPRFSGGIQLTLAAGAPFADWLVELSMGGHVAPRIGAFTRGLSMSSYETSLFFTQRPDHVLEAPPALVTTGADREGATA